MQHINVKVFVAGSANLAEAIPVFHRWIQESVFPYLDAPIARVGSEFTPVGFSRILERAILPNSEKVLAAARKILAY